MARPKKDGLSYFPKDTSFYRDRRIRALIGRFGADGAMLYDYIMCEAYREDGYYVSVDNSFVDIAAADLNMTPEKIGLILDYLLNTSMLLDSQLFKTVKVLTSHGIQAQWQEVKKSSKRAIDVNGELWLLSEAETESFIKVRHNDDYSEKKRSYSEKNIGYSEGKTIKESKIKKRESKEDITTSSSSAQAHVEIPTNKAVAVVVSDFLDRINPMAPKSCLDELSNYAKSLGEAVCKRAFDIALAEKKTTWSYIRAILQNCSAKGIKCIADWEAVEEKRRARSPREKGVNDGSVSESMKRDLENLRRIASRGEKG